MKKLSIQTRLVLFHTAAMTLVVALVLGLLFSLSSQEILTSAQATLEERVSQGVEEVEYTQGRLEFDSELLSLENGVYLSVYQPGGLLHALRAATLRLCLYAAPVRRGSCAPSRPGARRYSVLDLQFPVEGYGTLVMRGGGVPHRGGAGLPGHAAPGLGAAAPAGGADRPVRVPVQPAGFAAGGANHPDGAEHPAGAGPLQAGAPGGGPGRNLHLGPNLRQPAGPGGGQLPPGEAVHQRRGPRAAHAPLRGADAVRGAAGPGGHAPGGPAAGGGHPPEGGLHGGDGLPAAAALPGGPGPGEAGLGGAGPLRAQRAGGPGVWGAGRGKGHRPGGGHPAGGGPSPGTRRCCCACGGTCCKTP